MKTKLTKSLCLSAIVGVALLTATGCGGSKSEPANSAGQTGNTAEQSGQAEQVAKVKIKIVGKASIGCP